MHSIVDAHALVSAARGLVRNEGATTAGLWPRAAALLARQGLELAMARLWDVTAPGLENTSSRCQLLCLGDMLNDRELAGRATLTWTSLSGACHHRVYELPPTASELNSALETVSDLADAVEQLRARVRA
jgi:hypothetical protein